MAVKSNIHGPFELKTNVEQMFTYVNSFQTDGVNPPTDQDMADGTVNSRLGVGQFQVLFPVGKRPIKLLKGDASILGDEPLLSAKVVSYTASTGVLVIQVYEDDGVSGIPAAIETTDKVVQFECKFTYSEGGSVT